MRNDQVLFNYFAVDRDIESLSMSPDGYLTATPVSEDAGDHKIAIIAVRGECVGALIVYLKIYSVPQISDYTPNTKYFELNITDNVTFSVRATTEAINTKLSYQWYVDDIDKKINSTKYTYVARELGVHNVTVNFTDSFNLSNYYTWEFTVVKNDLAPVLLNIVPSVILYNNTLSEAYDLNDFFVDPEKGKLTFSYKEIESSYFNLSRADILVNISKNGYVTYIPINGKTGTAFFKFFATDSQNSTTQSNQVKADVTLLFTPLNKNISVRETFCGDLSCNGNENCTICPFDCGKCKDAVYEGCLPVWSCSAWSECMPTKLKTRICYDTNKCLDNRTQPLTELPCIYQDFCSDGIKNHNETGIDCGGSCPVCQNCTDGIQNGLETGVDCGGSCNACSTCNNNILDGNESDVDCGGNCEACSGGNACRVNKDCKSLLCKYLVCEYPTCFDQIKNQGEKGIDCEGPCNATCNTCTDNIMNGNEEGIDCGGGCRACATCTDGIKNGKEVLTDCGGNCQSCNLINFVLEYQKIMIFMASTFIFLATLLLGYLAYLVSNPESASKIYNSKKFFATLLFMHNLWSPIRRLVHRVPYLSENQYKNYIKQITNLISKKDYGNQEYYNLLIKIISEIGVSQNSITNVNTFDLLKSSSLPNILKIFIIGFAKKIEILSSSNFVTAEQKIDFEAKLRFLLLELSKP